jgi:multiple sugar transport system permease protein
MKGNGGYLNNMLINMGIIEKAIPWMEQQPFVWVALTAATVWWTIGYNMMLFVNSLNEIDPQLYEASSIDGAGFWVQLRYIILPSIKNIFFFVLMTTIIASFNVYGQPRLMTQGGPGDSTKPLIMAITSTIMDRNDLGVGSAMTILMGIIIVACSVGQYYLTREKEALR